MIANEWNCKEDIDDRLIEAVRSIGPCTWRDARRHAGLDGLTYAGTYKRLTKLVRRGILKVGKSGHHNVYEIAGGRR